MLQDRITGMKARFSEYTELRAQVNAQQAVTLLKGSLVNNTSAKLGGISARVYKNGIFGFASAPEYDDATIANVIKAATENAVFLDGKAKKGGAPLGGCDVGFTAPKIENRLPDQKYLIDFASELDAYITSKYPTLESRAIMCGTLIMEKLLTVSEGSDVHSVTPRGHIYIMMTKLAADGTPIELYEPAASYGLFDELFTDPKALYAVADKVYEQVCRKAEGVYTDAGVKTCILHSDLGGMLVHEAVGHTVEADFVLGGSVAGVNMNKQVASELITMVDFANTYNGQLCAQPVFVDDEGTPARDAVLIENGVLRSYMHNKESARHFGVEPTGNARAYAFSDEPLIRMRNTAILPGKDKLDDMIASIDDGYFLVKTGNGQADTTGEFTFSIEMGYEIKGGKLGRAIRDTTISGVAFEVLKTVDMLSDEMSWNCSGMCGKKQPMPVGMGGPAIKCRVNIGGR